MNKTTLQRQQLDRKIKSFSVLQKEAMPPSGWIKAVRSAIGMSLQQLGERLQVSKPAVKQMEQREAEGSITIKALREAAKALDMQLVYGFVPNDGSLEALIDRKAKELATKIVMRTSQTMKLEDQENTPARLKKAIEERAAEIKNEMPRMLWD
jgi:predicted DNA-binding mobile mystery protein A